MPLQMPLHMEYRRHIYLKSTVKDTWTKEGVQLKAIINRLKKLQVKAGFQSDNQVNENGVQIVEIAMFNELGTSKIPSRPFMRTAVDNHPDEISNMVSELYVKLIDGEPAENILNYAGVTLKGLIQKEIKDGNFEPNALSTIKKKGSNKPLIDTGMMRQSVEYVVDKK